MVKYVNATNSIYLILIIEIFLCFLIEQEELTKLMTQTGQHISIREKTKEYTSSLFFFSTSWLTLKPSLIEEDNAVGIVVCFSICSCRSTIVSLSAQLFVLLAIAYIGNCLVSTVLMKWK